jgi:hypothetical protein
VHLLDQALRLQACQRLSQRGAADVHLFGKHGLWRKLITLREVLIADVGEYFPRNAARQIGFLLPFCWT